MGKLLVSELDPFKAGITSTGKLPIILSFKFLFSCFLFFFPQTDLNILTLLRNNTEDGTGAYDYPTPPDVFFQWIQGWIGGILNDSLLFRALPGRWQAYIFGTMAHMSQPPIGPLNTHIKTYLPDALHFRRGTQNMRVRGLELEIPIPPLASDPTQPDFTIVQRAWWDAIMESYTDPTAPMRIAMELRIMGDSDIIMAPQRGNKFGTASIEVVSSMAAVADGSWDPYAQRIANKWMALGDENSAALNIRPHWAKEWYVDRSSSFFLVCHLSLDASSLTRYLCITGMVLLSRECRGKTICEMLLIGMKSPYLKSTWRGLAALRDGICPRHKQHSPTHYWITFSLM